MVPLSVRTANMISRAVIQLVDDSKMMQLVQIGVLDEEDVEGDGGAEHFQPYGFGSVPLPGAEAILLCPNGDRSHPLVIATADRRWRPVDGEAGDVFMWHKAGAVIRMVANGDIEIRPASGGQVFVREDGGTTDRLVKKSEFDGHMHGALGLSAPSGGGPVTGQTAGAAAVAGTQLLRVQ
jgi:phage baseplate assembly protein V